MRVRVALAAAMALLSSGCLPTNVTLRPDAKLDPTQGIVVAALECGRDLKWGEWYQSGVDSKSYFSDFNRAAIFGCSKGLQAVPMKEGRY